jgi:hypothetical protein
MKEMRFSCAGEIWRVAFAFDPHRQAVLLVGGHKGGADQRWFYKRLIQVAADRYGDHIATLQKQAKEVPRGKKAR